jgi:signal transduction histidine kinase/ActR/RegA family two-component response regulator
MGRKAIIAGLALLLLASRDSRAGERPPETVGAAPKRVLALLDFGKHAPANVIWDATLRETLEAGAPNGVEYYAEFFDAARFTHAEHTAVMHDYLGRKYADKRIDVIVAMDLSTRFLVGPGRDLFVDVPVVHTVALGEHPAATSGDPRLVGIRGVFDARHTLEMALGFHPATREVVIVCATARRDGFFDSELRRQLAGMEARVRLTYLVDLPLAETLAQTRNLSAHALVLFVVSYDPNDESRVRRSPRDVASEIARVSGVPVYGLFSSYLYDGVVGGYVYSLEEAAAMAGRTALRILAGTRPADIAPMDAPIVPMFDWRQLQRWGIDEAQLPVGSKLLFRGVGAWETSRKYFVGGAVVLALELALIGGLLLERRGRREALRAVKRSHAELVQRIAERERAEQELRENNVMLAQVQDGDRRKDEFLATLGHELRNPLAPISIAVAIMRERPEDSTSMVWAREMIGRQVTLLSRLVDDLLDVSRITLGKVDLRQQRLDLAAIAQQALDASRQQFDEQQHQVLFEPPPEPVAVRGDGVRLTQVISNLLNNASKYTKPGGRVIVRVERDGPDAVVVVTDNGVGIPADMIEHVFDPFTQVASAREHAHGGLGIGLTLVKGIVEMHGGSVRATSAGEGRGSEFVVRLPALSDEEALKASGRHAAPLHRTLVARRILVVDDNVDAAESLRRALALRRHAVDVVHDGLAAVEAAQRLEPDVVLLDIDLPQLDGLEVARRLRARWAPGDGGRRPLLVATTGLGRDVDRERTRQAGFDHHLVKPIDLGSLESLMAAAPPPEVRSM